MVVALGSPDCFTGSPYELRKESRRDDLLTGHTVAVTPLGGNVFARPAVVVGARLELSAIERRLPCPIPALRSPRAPARPRRKSRLPAQSHRPHRPRRGARRRRIAVHGFNQVHRRSEGTGRPRRWRRQGPHDEPGSRSPSRQGTRRSRQRFHGRGSELHEEDVSLARTAQVLHADGSLHERSGLLLAPLRDAGREVRAKWSPATTSVPPIRISKGKGRSKKKGASTAKGDAKTATVPGSVTAPAVGGEPSKATTAPAPAPPPRRGRPTSRQSRRPPRPLLPPSRARRRPSRQRMLPPPRSRSNTQWNEGPGRPAFCSPPARSLRVRLRDTLLSVSPNATERNVLDPDLA